MTSEHHVCRWCGARFRLTLKSNPSQPTRPLSLVSLDPEGFFDTLRCAAKYAVSAARTIDRRK